MEKKRSEYYYYIVHSTNIELNFYRVIGYNSALDGSESFFLQLTLRQAMKLTEFFQILTSSDAMFRSLLGCFFTELHSCLTIVISPPTYGYWMLNSDGRSFLNLNVVFNVVLVVSRSFIDYVVGRGKLKQLN